MTGGSLGIPPADRPSPSTGANGIARRRPPTLTRCRAELIGARIISRRRLVDEFVDDFTFCACCDRPLTAGDVVVVVEQFEGGVIRDCCPDCAGTA